MMTIVSGFFLLAALGVHLLLLSSLSNNTYFLALKNWPLLYQYRKQLVSTGSAFLLCLPFLFSGENVDYGRFHARGTVGLEGIGQGWVSCIKFLRGFTPYFRVNSMDFPVVSYG